MHEPQKRSPGFPSIALGAAVLCALLAYFSLRTLPVPEPPPPAAKPPLAAESLASETSSTAPRTDSPVETGGLGALLDALQVANAADAPGQLARLRAWLRGLPPGRAASLIAQLLDSGRNFPVPLEFRIGADGALDAAPTLRVWLLDTLSLVDPAAAADYAARRIFTGTQSADEWAVGLRAYALGRPGDTEFLKARAGELLFQSDWRARPSTGYLEAFDTLVYARATEFTPQLAALVQNKSNRAVGHAAYLTLDRLVCQETATVLARLREEPGLMAGREQTRASYFARADVRDPAQRALLEDYLLDPGLVPAELDTFAGTFPNANYMVSKNLLTRSDTSGGEDRRAADVGALRTVEAWMADPRFQSRLPVLQKIQERLLNFVK